MTGDVLGVVVIGTIHKRAVAAVHATRTGRRISDDAIGQLLTDLIRVIDSHEKQAVRIRTAAMALDGAAGTRRDEKTPT